MMASKVFGIAVLVASLALFSCCALGGRDMPMGSAAAPESDAGYWRVAVEFRPGGVSSNVWWAVEITSSGEMRSRVRRWNDVQNRVMEDTHTRSLAQDELHDLDELLDNRFFQLPHQCKLPNQHDSSSVAIAYSSNGRSHEVRVFGVTSIVEAGANEVPAETLDAVKYVCLVMGQVLRICPAPNDWQNSAYYLDLADRAGKGVDPQ